MNATSRWTSWGGALLASVLSLLTVQLARAVELTEIHYLEGLTGTAPRQLALEGDYLLLQNDGSYWVYDFLSGQPPYRLMTAGGETFVQGSIDIDGGRVAISGPPGTFVFDVATGAQIHEISTLEGQVAIDGNWLVLSGGPDPDLEARYTLVYDLVTGLFVREILAPDGFGAGGDIDVDGNHLVVAAVDEYVQQYDITTGSFVRELWQGDPTEYYEVHWATEVVVEGIHAEVGSQCSHEFCPGANAALVFDLNTGQQVDEWGLGHGDLGERVAASGDYALLGGGGTTGEDNSSGCIGLYSLSSGYELGIFEDRDRHPGFEHFGTQIAISGNRLAVLGARRRYVALYTVDFNQIASIADQSFDEQAGLVGVEVSLARPAETPVSVDYRIVPGSAEPGQDFDPPMLSGSLDVHLGQPSAYIEVAIVDDLEWEGMESFTVELSNPVATELDPAASTATFTIEDDEYAAPPGAIGGRRAGFSVAAGSWQGIDEILVGMPGANGGAGVAALVPVKATDGEVLPESFAPEGLQAGDEFGFSVALEFSYAVVGARGDDDQGAQAGAVYVFYRPDMELNYKLFGQGAHAGSRFGQALALDGNRLIVGAHRDDENGNQSGSAHVFRLFPSSAEMDHVLLASDGQAGDHFGRAVDYDRGTVAVGAPQRDDFGENSGAVYLYSVLDGRELRKLLAPDGVAGDRFGSAVAVSDQRVFVGAPDRAGGGGVYVFDVDTGAHLTTWLPESASEGKMGLSLSANVVDEFLLVGIPGDDGDATNQGVVALYDLATGLRVETLEHHLVQEGQETGRSGALSRAGYYAGAPFTDGPEGAVDAGSVIGSSLPNPGSAPGDLPTVRSIRRAGAGDPVQSEFVGELGVAYREERSTDLVNWIEVDSFIASGWLETRTPAANEGEADREFYR